MADDGKPDPPILHIRRRRRQILRRFPSALSKHFFALFRSPSSGVHVGTPPSANEVARPKAGCSTELLWDKVRADPSDFNSWTALIGAAERTEDVRKIRAVYDAFLAEFPLCYGYWKKYADHEAKLAGVDGVEAIYERATAAFPYSVDLWTHRASHAISLRRDADEVRTLFENGLAYAGTDWNARALWDRYIDFEQHSGCGSPMHVSRLYARVLQVPLRELDHYWTGFQTFIADRSPSAVIPAEELTAIEAAVGTFGVASTSSRGGDGAEEAAAAAALAAATTAPGGDPRILKFKESRGETYRSTASVRATREPFERNVKRPYFHVRPLDDAQLANWEVYLDNEEISGDVASVTRLYERCLVSCASYPEFWLRYARWQASEKGQGVDAARAALQRAARVFCKRHVDTHLALARFEEDHGDADAARACYATVADDVAPGLIRCIVQRANFERRCGNTAAARGVYEAAMQTEKSKEGAGSKIYGVLACKYAEMLHEAGGDVDGARAVYERGVDASDGGNAAVWEGWINFERSVGEPSAALGEVAKVVERCCDGPDAAKRLPAHERERFSSMYVEYADLIGSSEALAAAERAHLTRFPRGSLAGGGFRNLKRSVSSAGLGVADVAAKAAKDSAAHAAYYAQYYAQYQ